MPRVDDYTAAFDLAKTKIIQSQLKDVARLSGAKLANGGLELDFLGQACRVSLDPFKVSLPGDQEPGLTDQVLILHYLAQADGRSPSGQWIAFREIPGADTYHPVFYKRAVAPLLSAFGHRPHLLAELASMYPHRPGQTGDVSVIVRAFPRVEVLLAVWAGDEEFSPEATILFDGSLPGYLTPEDAAWLSGRIVYPLAGRAKGIKT